MQTASPILLSKEHDITAFASNDPSRYVIQSVHYNAAGSYVEATNGRQLVRVPVEASEDFPPITGYNGEPTPDCLLPIGPLKKALSGIPNGKSLPILKHVALTAVAGEPAKVRLTTNDLDTEQSAVVKAIDGNYPNIDRVIPDKAPVFSIALSPDELKIICEYCAKHAADNADHKPSIKFIFTADLEPVRWSITTSEGRKVTGILMPMRLT